MSGWDQKNMYEKHKQQKVKSDCRCHWQFISTSQKIPVQGFSPWPRQSLQPGLGGTSERIQVGNWQMQQLVQLMINRYL